MRRDDLETTGGAVAPRGVVEADPYRALVGRIALRHGVPIEQVDRRARARQAKSGGLLPASMAARTVAVSLAIADAQNRLTGHLAAGARHVSGRQVEDAIAAARGEVAAGRLVTLGYWSQPDESPDSIAAHYAAELGALAGASLAGSISIKVDLLGDDWGRVHDVLHVAREHGLRVHFDAQGFETIDAAHALLERAVTLGFDVSGTLPSRFARSLADAERFIDWRIPVRLVKGQGGDPTQPRIDPRESYRVLVERLAGRAAHVGVATHDRRVAEPALDHLVRAGTPCTLEQMRSLPRLDFLADARGVPVRAYVAWGRFGLPYAIGEIARRPAIVAWILRDLLVRGRPAARHAGGKEAS